MKAEERATQIGEALFRDKLPMLPGEHAIVTAALTLAQQEARAELREGLALALADVSVSPDGNSYARLTETTYRRLRALLEGQ